jgi:hypothetical protein
MFQLKPPSMKKVIPHRVEDEASGTWWEAIFREKSAANAEWRFSPSELFIYRLFLGVLVFVVAAVAWYFWQPRSKGVFPVKKIKFVEDRRTTLPKTGGTRGEVVNVELTVPAHYSVTVEIEGIQVSVWVDEEDEEYLSDGKLTIEYLRGKKGIQILSVRD